MLWDDWGRFWLVEKRFGWLLTIWVTTDSNIPAKSLWGKCDLTVPFHGKLYSMNGRWIGRITSLGCWWPLGIILWLSSAKTGRLGLRHRCPCCSLIGSRGNRGMAPRLSVWLSVMANKVVVAEAGARGESGRVNIKGGEERRISDEDGKVSRSPRGSVAARCLMCCLTELRSP